MTTNKIIFNYEDQAVPTCNIPMQLQAYIPMAMRLIIQTAPARTAKH